MEINYIKNPFYSGTNDKELPIVVLLVGNNEPNLKIISKQWFERGFNCLINSPMDVLVGNNEERAIEIVKFIDDYFRGDDGFQRILCFQSISNGTVLFGHFLKYIQDNEEYLYLMRIIRATIIDNSSTENENDFLYNNFLSYQLFLSNKSTSINTNTTTTNYQYLISPLNTWNHVIIHSKNDYSVKSHSINSFIKSIKLNLPNLKYIYSNKNNDENFDIDDNEISIINAQSKYSYNTYLIEKVFDTGSNSFNFKQSLNEYQKVVNQLIDIVYMNQKKILCKL
ncbi:hypothetical protein RB653_009113 [Dictyostelium firmibasis]|uniref:Uncharacterized protein n=1 Tax=Dictyostelium firmibasis TaxID=79012 RepID=A0AAN7U1E4_9MYCE